MIRVMVEVRARAGVRFRVRVSTVIGVIITVVLLGWR